MTKEEALKVISGIMNNYHIDSMTNQRIDEALSVAIQALKAEPIKHGRWTTEHLTSTGGGTYPIERCSECECASVVGRTNYCPNCGAKMDEVEE